MNDDKLTLINPPGLHPTSGYAHVTIAREGRTAHLAGLCPLDADEKVVGPDLDAQIDQLTASALAPAFLTASTLLGVAALGYGGQLVEVDLTAALAE